MISFTQPPEACNHTRTDIREFRYDSGVVQYRLQCLDCGKGVGSAISKAKLSQRPPVADMGIVDRYTASQRELWRQWHIANGLKEVDFDAINRQRTAGKIWWREYNAYLQTEEWKELRRVVLERDDYECQGCLEKRAEHVHHLHYKNVGNELICDLVSLCVACHEKTHRGPNKFGVVDIRFGSRPDGTNPDDDFGDE